MQIVNAALELEHAKQAGTSASPQLRQAANQFESSFLEELLKPMTQDSMFGSGDSTSGSMGTVSSMATQALADGIARDGGLGIAKQVLAELAPVEAAQSGKATVAGTKCGGCAARLASLTDASSTGSNAAIPASGVKPLGQATAEEIPLSTAAAVMQNSNKTSVFSPETHSSIRAASR